MNTLTFTTAQATLLFTVAFLAGVGGAYICHAIIRAAVVASLVEPEPEVVVVEARRDLYRFLAVPAAADPVLPARQRFTTKVASSAPRSNTSAPSLVISPQQWAQRSFDDPRDVRLSVHIGAGAKA